MLLNFTLSISHCHKYCSSISCLINMNFERLLRYNQLLRMKQHLRIIDMFNNKCALRLKVISGEFRQLNLEEPDQSI